LRRRLRSGSAARSIWCASAEKSGASLRSSHATNAAGPHESRTRSRCSISSCVLGVRCSTTHDLNGPPATTRGTSRRNAQAAKREQLPPGLCRRRKRDGAPGDVIWCWYRPHGSKRAVQLSTGTLDVEEAQRFLYRKLAEDPKARAERIAAESVTVSHALALLKQ